MTGFHATVLPAYCPAGVVFGNNSLLSNHYFSSSVHIIAQQNTHVNAQRNNLYFCIKYMMVNTNNYKISGMLIDANSTSLGRFHTAVDVGCWYLLLLISKPGRCRQLPMSGIRGRGCSWKLNFFLLNFDISQEI